MNYDLEPRLIELEPLAKSFYIHCRGGREKRNIKNQLWELPRIKA